MAGRASQQPSANTGHEVFILVAVPLVYRFQAQTTLGNGGNVTLWIAGTDGRLLRFDAPVAGGGAAQVDDLFGRLHFAQIGGVPYRIFVSFLGLAIATLSVTGVLIWMKKRSARLPGRKRARSSRFEPSGVPIAAE